MTSKEIQLISKSLEAVSRLDPWRIIVLIFFISMLKDLQLILKFLEANPMLVMFLATIGLICFMVNVLLKVIKPQKEMKESDDFAKKNGIVGEGGGSPGLRNTRNRAPNTPILPTGKQ